MVAKKRRVWPIVLTVVALLFVFLIILPLSFSLMGNTSFGNVAVIPIEGPIMGSAAQSAFGPPVVSSQDIVHFIESASENSQVEVLVLEINSPGGGAVASDEIAQAVKNVEKPVVALIREVGASGGYWVASAADHIITNRMSITGSIGVISSYLEFSGLMDEYGVGYERLVAGDRKDIGIPFKQLDAEEKLILQGKLDRIHDFFIQEIAENRGMSEAKVRSLATGEFYLGVEALEFGLVDQLGGEEETEQFIKERYGLEEVNYIVYQKQAGFFDLLGGVLSQFSFQMGNGIGSAFTQQNNQVIGLY